MATLDVKVNVDDMTTYAKGIADPRPALEVIGTRLAQRNRDAYSVGGHHLRGGQQWQKRAVPNVVGIIADLGEGKVPPGRRFEPGQTLVSTGRLGDSISHALEGRNKVVLGTNVPYAVDHQLGKTVVLAITGAVKKGVGKILRTMGDVVVGGLPLSKSLGWIIGWDSGTVEFDLPRRDVIDITNQDEALALKILEDFIEDPGG